MIGGSPARVVIEPIAPLLKSEFGLPNCTVLDRLKTSQRNSRLARSVMRKSRWIAKSNSLVRGQSWPQPALAECEASRLAQQSRLAGLWLAAKFFGCNIAFRQPQVVQSGSPGGRAERRLQPRLAGPTVSV